MFQIGQGSLGLSSALWEWFRVAAGQIWACAAFVHAGEEDFDQLGQGEGNRSYSRRGAYPLRENSVLSMLMIWILSFG